MGPKKRRYKRKANTLTLERVLNLLHETERLLWELAKAMSKERTK